MLNKAKNICNDQFKFVSAGFDMVEKDGGITKTHQILKIALPKNGYIYVYCNNVLERSGNANTKIHN
jgi:hypothetical protein